MGKKATGEPFDPLDIVKIYPMWIDDTVEDWKENGPSSILTAAVPSIFGIGVQVYDESKQIKPGKSGRAKKPAKPKRPSRK